MKRVKVDLKGLTGNYSWMEKRWIQTIVLQFNQHLKMFCIDESAPCVFPRIWPYCRFYSKVVRLTFCFLIDIPPIDTEVFFL